MIVQQQYEDLVEENSDLDIEVTGLRSKVSLLEGQVQILDGVRIEKREKDEKLIEMKEQLAEKHLIEVENSALEKSLSSMSELLTERVHLLNNCLPL